MAPSDAALAADLRWSIGRLGRRLIASHAAATSSCSLTALGVLRVLSRCGTRTVGELARHEGVRAASMSRTVRDLVEAGFVLLASDPADGRRRVVTLTVRGREVVAADRRTRDAWLAQRLNRLDEAEQAVVQAAAPLLEAIARDGRSTCCERLTRTQQ